jgi:small subunit ribosomal protein S21
LTPRVWSTRKSSGSPDHDSDSNTIGKHLQVFVRDNNVEQALRALKRKMQREGVFREMKRRKAYEKPSERRTREKTEAIRRVRKAARKQAQRDGLIQAVHESGRIGVEVRSAKTHLLISH